MTGAANDPYRDESAGTGEGGSGTRPTPGHSGYEPSGHTPSSEQQWQPSYQPPPSSAYGGGSAYGSGQGYPQGIPPYGGGTPQHGGQPYGQAPPPGGGQPYGQGGRKTNVLAIVGLVCAIAGLFTGIAAPVGAVLGHVARRQISQTGEEGLGLAKGAIWVGWILTGLYLLGCCAVGLLAINSNGR
jgi:hypothetical protein